MKNKSFLFISCDEAKHICDKAQYNEATTWEKFKLNLRYLWCHITRAYVNRNKKLTKAVKSSKITCLKNSEKQQLKEVFHEELEKQHH
ncbi:hypothetical protein [Xanthomarina spongicola]|uniref:Uncharacterized protein n=1 Tax=Xanthomarina spongicola TaxID=570520 RepID=A0A316DM08_9FLAO|nr:hypothetical protein [Xanthomarina spongicola]PWK19227.1 hypothetical protein LX78_01708 [Xanthomarina spongicola]